MTEPSIKLLALDPGSRNFAWALVDSTRGLVDHGMLPVELRSIKAAEIRDFTYIVNEFLHQKRDQADQIIWERYQTRSRASLNNETINVAIGLLGSQALQHGLEIQDPVMPATWKNAYNRSTDESRPASKDPWIEMFEPLIPGPKTRMVHRRDAAGLGWWCLSKMLDRSLFEPMTWAETPPWEEIRAEGKAGSDKTGSKKIKRRWA